MHHQRSLQHCINGLARRIGYIVRSVPSLHGNSIRVIQAQPPEYGRSYYPPIAMIIRGMLCLRVSLTLDLVAHRSWQRLRPISKSDTADTWKRQTAAIAAWRLLNLDQPARDLLKQLAGRAASPNCPKSDSDAFSAAALSLVEVPGTREIAVPCLKQLSEHTDASAASFASSILARVEAAVPVGPDEPEQQRGG